MENRYEEYSRFPDGQPFLFMPRLQRTALHCSREANWHENLEVQLCEEGEGSVLLDGQRVGFAQGETVVVNTGIIHHTGTEGSLVYSCLILDLAFCREAGIDPTALRFAAHIASKKIALLFHEIEHTLYACASPCRTARLRRLALSLLIILREEHTLPGVPGEAAGTTYQNVKNAIQYIRTHESEPLSLATLAQALYVNKYVLARQFKAVTRQTVVQYVHSCRCQRAHALLQAGATVSEAARECGFTNLSFFARTFRRYIGLSPSACKRK